MNCHRPEDSLTDILNPRQYRPLVQQIAKRWVLNETLLSGKDRVQNLFKGPVLAGSELVWWFCAKKVVRFIDVSETDWLDPVKLQITDILLCLQNAYTGGT